jgi:hypothetical protein
MNMTINNASQFRDEFAHMGRKDQFSYEALGLLYDYLEEVEPDYSLDVIELCCDYAEGEVEDIARDYGIDLTGLDEEGANDVVLDFLNYQTSLVGVTQGGTIMYCTSF